MQETVRVKPTHDGTYTVYQGTHAVVTGLTRLQAERYGATVTRRTKPAHAPSLS